MAKVKVTRNYQVTIPSDVRRTFKIKEGDVMDIQALDSERVVLRKTIPEEELAGAWDEEMDQVMEEVREIWKTWKLPRKNKNKKSA